MTFRARNLGRLVAASIGRVRAALPEGRALPLDTWRPRHRVILWLVWLHAVGIFGFGVFVGAGPVHSLIEGSTVALWAVAGNYRGFGQRTRSAAASFGLLTASALVVHLAGGAIEAHFHFFVMIAVIALYQDWVPFLLAIGFVVVEHGLVAVILPGSVYDTAEAQGNPWKWAVIHGALCRRPTQSTSVSMHMPQRLAVSLSLLRLSGRAPAASASSARTRAPAA